MSVRGARGRLRINRRGQHALADDCDAQFQMLRHLFLKSHRAEPQPFEIVQIFGRDGISEDDLLRVAFIDGEG